MTILCLEGPSAVGKTTVCTLLQVEHGFERIPEVNELFVRSAHEPLFWYFERQVERWRMAHAISSSGRIAVLDGDPFQPLWYNAIFAQHAAQSMPDTLAFYREQVERGSLRVPDKYYVLTATQQQLRARKSADTSRSRRNFDKHLQLVAPQLAWFTALKELAPGCVSILQADDAQGLAGAIGRDALAVTQHNASARLFEAMAALAQGIHPSPHGRLP